MTHQPGLAAALERLKEDAIRGDPCWPLRWISGGQRHLAKALAAQGFKASQRVAPNLLQELNYSCQANPRTGEGGNHPDRNTQFSHINAMVIGSVELTSKARTFPPRAARKRKEPRPGFFPGELRHRQS